MLHSLLVIICLLLAANPVRAQYHIAKDRIGDEMQVFHRHQNPALLRALIFAMDEDDNLTTNSNSHPPLMGFLATAFVLYDSSMDDYISLSDSLSNAQQIVRIALVLSQTKDTILNWPFHSPAVNDMRWGAFFASGDTTYLSRLASELPLCENRDSLMLFLTGATAKWSLCSNARQYFEVKHYLQGYLEHATNALRPHLEEILTKSPSEMRKQMMDGLGRFKK